MQLDDDLMGLLRGCVVLAVEWGSSPAETTELDTIMVEIPKLELIGGLLTSSPVLSSALC